MGSTVRVMNREDITGLESLLLSRDGLFRIACADDIRQFSDNKITQFCVKYGMYCVPTIELLLWLGDQIDDVDQTIEVGAGNGLICDALDIIGVDNYQQEMPKYKEALRAMSQPAVTYGDNVIKMDALAAVKKYTPELVIGCWVTHKYNPKQHHLGGNEIGLNENEILKRVNKYIMVGNDETHSYKPILNKPHETIKADWLISRAFDQSKNSIYIWS